jgi:CHAD domain-containing protein
MAYFFERGETFAEGFRRIGAEENKAAIDALACEAEAMPEGIHQARRCFKRLRSLFRLFRSALGKGPFRDANRFYQGKARELASLRDISSLIEAANLLHEEYGGLLKEDAFDGLLALLEAEKTALEQKLPGQASQAEHVVQALREARGRFTSLELKGDEEEALLEELALSYRKARNYCQQCQEAPTIETMHEWRKQAKHLWHAHLLLHKAWPKVFKGYAKAYKALGDALGDYHDLALLQQKMVAYEGLLPDDTRRLLHGLAQEHLREQWRQALSLGQRLHAEKPGAFRRRMKAVLAGWEASK